MKLIKPSFEIIEQQAGLEGMYKMIELAGRTCYKSEDKITEDSAKGFVERMIKSGHGAMLEHGTVYLKAPTHVCVNSNGDVEYNNDLDVFRDNPYSVVTEGAEELESEEYVEHLYVTTNYRVLVENFFENRIVDILNKYLCEPTEYHEKRVCVRFICDRGVSHEFVRHRVFSFAQESTRYCNYSKDKFGNELTFIIPCWLDLKSTEDEIHIDGDAGEFCYPEDIYTSNFLYTLRYAERVYLDLLEQWEEKVPDKRYKSGYRNNPWAPQQARAVLPNSLKTELVMTGFLSDWEHFFKLRDAGSAHPQAQELAKPLHEEFIKRGYING